MLRIPVARLRFHWPFRVSIALLALAVGGIVVAQWSPAVAVEPPLSYRLLLPGVSADSAEPPATGAVATRHVSQTLDGSLVVTGEVHNGTADAITSVVVSATANGVTRTSSALAEQVSPGGDALFQVVLPGITDANAGVSTSVVSYKAVSVPGAVSGLDATISGLRALQVTVTDPGNGRTTVSDSTTVLVMLGVVTNNSTQPASDISVVIGFYDEVGNVRLVASTTTITVLFRDPGDRTLQPGQTGTFEVPFSRAAYLGVTGTLRPVVFASAKASAGS